MRSRIQFHPNCTSFNCERKRLITALNLSESLDVIPVSFKYKVESLVNNISDSAKPSNNALPKPFELFDPENEIKHLALDIARANNSPLNFPNSFLSITTCSNA